MIPLQDINLVIAHALEARAILEYFSLELVDDKNFKVYQNQSGMQAIVSGMGVENATAATSWLGERDRVREIERETERETESKVRAWLNIGIAGHPQEEIGNCFCASKIFHRSSGNTQFPAPVLNGIKAATVVTVDEPELDYPENVLYEMEASGFWAAATEFTSLEFVQCLKIVSDNKKQSTENVTKQLVLDLISAKLDKIQDCCSQLQSLVSEFNQAYGLEPFFVETMESCLSAYHFTVTQKIQLKRLIQRYSALELSSQLEKAAAHSFNSSNDLINELSKALSRQ